jgi:hypothetical protein
VHAFRAGLLSHTVHRFTIEGKSSLELVQADAQSAGPPVGKDPAHVVEHLRFTPDEAGAVPDFLVPSRDSLKIVALNVSGLAWESEL